jgi:eukaryotic-like serine/threonine-protein kinase
LVDGERLTDRYVLEERIAAGGMGGVYSARDERLDRPIAIKILKEELAQDPRFVERFRREARSVAALSHPNVAAVYDYGEVDGRHFIVMELVEGRDLARMLREGGPLEPERAARIGAGAARALEHAHAAGMIHRDIKPANIMVSPGDRVKVTDFGIARAMGESTLTATGSVMGTAQYISPEQAEGDPITPSSDIYSLGIVLFEMLTGSVPFTGDNALAVAMKHVKDRVPPPSTRTAHIPATLDSIVTRATSREPGDRYMDSAAMATELEATSVSLEAAGDTDVLTPEEEEQTVWPIPGTRYDPQVLGRRVIAVLLGLAAIALALLVWRILMAEPAGDAGRQTSGSGDRGAAGGQQTTETPSPTPTPDAGITLGDYTGQNYEDVEAVLKEEGLSVGKQDVDDEAAEGTILDQDPDPGTVLQEGAEVTLIVSKGQLSDDDSGPPEDAPGKGKAKGKDKDKEEEDD